MTKEKQEQIDALYEWAAAHGIMHSRRKEATKEKPGGMPDDMQKVLYEKVWRNEEFEADSLASLVDPDGGL
jgi:hypothetical protein